MPITISNVSGELKNSIGTLVRFYSKQKKSYSSFLNKGVFGKTLANLLGETHVISPENLSENLGVQKKDGSGPDISIKYEYWILLQFPVDRPKFSGIYKA